MADPEEGEIKRLYLQPEFQGKVIRSLDGAKRNPGIRSGIFRITPTLDRS